MSRAQPLTDRHELVRRANVETVFRAIGDHGPVSRNDLVGITGLSKPTVLAVVAALEDEGLVHGVPLPSAGAGRIPIGYQHNAEAAAVVGIDLGGTKTLVAVADLTGRILAEHEEPTSQAGGPAVVEQLATLARRVAREAGVSWSRVDAVTVGHQIQAMGFGPVLAAYGNLSARKFRQLWDERLNSKPFPEEAVKHSPPVSYLKQTQIKSDNPNK